MKSIRRTLIVNVMLLLVVALGTVAALVYQITRTAIQEKQNTARDLVNMQFALKRDALMLAQARAVVNDAQSQINQDNFRKYVEAAPLGIYAMAFGMNSHITAPIWMTERLPGPVSFRLNLLLATDIKLNDSDAMSHGFVQVNSDWGNIWRSKALSGPTLPLDVAQFNSKEPFEYHFDDLEITPGITAHRVVLKAPLIRTRVLLQELSPERASLGVASGLRRDPFRPERVTGPSWYAEQPRGPRTGRPPSGGRSQSPPFGSFLPTLYVQVAWDSTTSDPDLRQMEQERDEHLQLLDLDNQNWMRQLRIRLVWIGAVTLGIVMIGGWLLVGAGLSPLKRLSHAVSEVSAKDFKLRIEPEQLPCEVSSVADRLKQTLQQLQEAFARESEHRPIFPTNFVPRWRP